jgi:hypothetical protein
MNRREQALASARIAGYHDDGRSFTRLIVEARVNRQAMNAAWMDGKRALAAGVGCTCRDCAAKAGA